MTYQQQAQELFGEAWISTLANLVAVNRRTMQRWVSGKNEIPDWIPEAINETWAIWCAENKAELED